MLRISPGAPAADGARVQSLEGRLVGQWVGLSGDLVRQDLARVEDRRLVLDLAGVQHAGREGVELLRQLQAEGVTLRACPAYLRQLCDAESA